MLYRLALMLELNFSGAIYREFFNMQILENYAYSVTIVSEAGTSAINLFEFYF